MTNQFNDHHYLKICSEKTLQTNSQGFFMDFVQLVSENAGETWTKHVFGKLRCDIQRIKILYHYEGTKQPIINILSNVQKIYRKKDGQISQSRRLEADEAFSRADFKKCLGLYSQSVIRAPATGLDNKYDCGKTLALALWGRAQTLISLGDYPLALVDLQQALKESLPNLFKAEAYWKMGICYKALNDESKASVSFDLAEKLLGDDKKKSELEISRKQSLTCCKKDEPRVLPKCDKVSKTFPCASNKFSITKDERQGRFGVANQYIHTGETIIVEEPYAACLLPDMFGTNCHHCFKRLVAPMACSTCSNVAFCSPDCKEQALSSYHKYECKYLDLLIGSGMSLLSHTALRTITQNGFSKTLEIYKNKSKERIYSLCTNSEKRSPDDFLQRTLMAVFLLRCLQKSGYFGDNRKDQIIPTEEEFCICELLLYHLQMLQFNAHEIYETRRSVEHKFKGSVMTYIGVGIYPTVSLLNHECYPTVTRHFVGKAMVITASRPVQRNEQINENYGPIFARKALQQRQTYLSSRYWFDCKCKACESNWPSLDHGLGDASKRIRCSNGDCSYYFTLPLSKETLTCPKCKKMVSLSENILQLKWCEEQCELGINEMKTDNPKKAIEILCQAMDTFYRISCPPHRETYLAQETLQWCMASFGNVSETLVKKSQ